jgi:streptomycin 6-kinase
VLNVPDAMRRSAESQGPTGRAWLAALPGLVDELCHAWSLSLGEAFDGGKWAYVARVRVADGTEAVLKVAPPAPGFARQVAAIEAAAGRGYVRLYNTDPARHALLMEPLGSRLSVAAHSIEHVLDVLAATLLQAWQVPRPAEAIATPGFEPASGLIRILDELWPLLGEPCSPRLLTFARTLAERRAAAFDPDACVLCHGDAHGENALAVLAPRPGAESGYVFVDPDGFLCDPAYDLGVAMRGWTNHVVGADNPVALTRGWSTRLADATGLDEQAIWEWGLIQRVTTGLHLMRYGHRAEGQAYLASAERLTSG